MKKFKQIAYLALIIIIVVLSLTIYTNASKGEGQEQKEKVMSEIKYLESKLVDLLNTMNNIEARNYNIAVSEMPKQESEESSGGSSSSSGSGGESKEGSSGSESSGSESSGSTTQEKQDTKKFELKLNGVLTKEESINWDSIKNNIEVLYSSVPTITLDLYQQDINQEDILSFNRELDTLATVVKEEKKEETLTQLSKLYDLLPKFIKNVTEDELYKTVIETKSNVFKAYTKLDSKDWDTIENDIKAAIDVYSSLLTNTKIDSSKQYGINKGYVMINELQNATKVKDESVFLIKYKNLIEELNNL